MRRLLHKLAHFFGWNTGEVYVFWAEPQHRLMVGFRCHQCGELFHVHESVTERVGLTFELTGPLRRAGIWARLL